MLNNSRGQTVQRPVMTEYKHCKPYQEFFAISSNSNIEITDFKIHDECIEIHFTRNSDTTECPDYVSPITAIFTTAHARVRLFRFSKILTSYTKKLLLYRQCIIYMIQTIHIMQTQENVNIYLMKLE